jgi:hypothetical protein
VALAQLSQFNEDMMRNTSKTTTDERASDELDDDQLDCVVGGMRGSHGRERFDAPKHRFAKRDRSFFVDQFGFDDKARTGIISLRKRDARS